MEHQRESLFGAQPEQQVFRSVGVSSNRSPDAGIGRTSATFTTDHHRWRRTNGIRYSDDRKEPGPERTESPRSCPNLRHALVEAWTASSATVRSASITAASRYAGLSSGSMRSANAWASPPPRKP